MSLDLRADLSEHLAGDFAELDPDTVHVHVHKNDDVVGEVIRFQRGDGYAQYLVWNTNPCELIWLPVGDAWRIEEAHERGLRTRDVREKVRSERAIRTLFGSSDK